MLQRWLRLCCALAFLVRLGGVTITLHRETSRHLRSLTVPLHIISLGKWRWRPLLAGPFPVACPWTDEWLGG
jgi:predicted membrane-bound mannosyltransferase